VRQSETETESEREGVRMTDMTRYRLTDRQTEKQ
jgi:hypothetical protein